MNKNLNIFTGIIFIMIGFNAHSQHIFTVAGFAGYEHRGCLCDSIHADSTVLANPQGIAVDKAGNIYIADRFAVRKVMAGTHKIYTVAGNKLVSGYTGDNGLGYLAEISGAPHIALDDSSNIYISDSRHIIRKVFAKTGIIKTIAGRPDTSGYAGDGGSAQKATLNYPAGIAVDKAGNIYFSDGGNYLIRRIDVKTGAISTIAGRKASSGFSGDGGPADSAQIDKSDCLVLDDSDNVYFSQSTEGVIRKINNKTGIITTVVGKHPTVISGSNGDGEIADSAKINPICFVFDSHNNMYITNILSSSATIRKVDASTGLVSTIAGKDTGHTVCYCEGDVALKATFKYTWGLAVDANNHIYVSDNLQKVIRELTWFTGIEELSTKNEDGLKIYPNPNDGRFTINYSINPSTKEALLVITNLLGQGIRTYSLPINNTQYNIDDMGLSAGTYICQLYKDGQLKGTVRIAVVK